MDRVNRFSFKRKGSNRDKQAEKDKSEPPGYDYDQMTYLSQEVSECIRDELVNEFTFSLDQLLEMSGISCATAVAKIYPLDSLTKDNGAILVCCGPGNNGGYGLVCARHLKLFGYRPTVFHPQRPESRLLENLISQCEKMDIPFLSYFPSEPHLITDSFNLIVDAFYGLNLTPPDEPEFITYFNKVLEAGVPVASLDVPYGWDVDKGNPDGLHPETLISLVAPKLCAKLFKGRHHYLGGRFVPPDLAKKYQLNLPPYPGTDCCLELPVCVFDPATTTNEQEDNKTDNKINHDK